MNYEMIKKQLEREEESNTCGYNKFLKGESIHELYSDGSNTLFGVIVREQFLEAVVQEMRESLDDVNSMRTGRLTKSINKLVGVAKVNGKLKVDKLIDLYSWSHIGFCITNDTVLNPNFISHTTQGPSGGDKRLLEKMSLRELEQKIGRELNRENRLQIVKLGFPDTFRKMERMSQKSHKDGNRSTTSYRKNRLENYIKEFVQDLKDKGDDDSVSLIQTKLWDYSECIDIGSWVFRSLHKSTGLFEVRKEKRNGKPSLEVYLSEYGEEYRKELNEYKRRHTHHLLPMLIEPLPITPESNGGWLSETLQEPQEYIDGDIELSPKHYEFLNRQSKVSLQINPHTYRLMEILIDTELPLGRFEYHTLDDIPSVSQLLGLDNVQDKDEQDRLVRSHPDYKSVRREVSHLKDINLKKTLDGQLSRQVIDIGRKVFKDEKFYLPVKSDFRGRIYPRVPFINYQSNDSGRYLLRFSNKSPIDNRTEFWFKVGISNSCGNDKLSWDKRINWFDQHRNELINVGRMVDDDGDFRRGYDFLTSDFVDDPFCVYSLCNEYTKIFVDKNQDYSQVFVTVDCSCSGTSIFNSWRRNLTGGILTNLVDTPYPQDIYMEVWSEIKRRVKSNTFRQSHIEKIERSKWIRKMMKESYIPSQYSSSVTQQHHRLKQFNNYVLEPMELHFTDYEMKELVRVWEVSLDTISSINTVVRWFKMKTREVLDSGQKFIRFTSCTGSVMTLKYPKTERTNIRTFHYGSTKLKRQFTLNEVTDKVDRTGLLNGIVPNITHMTDSSSLCESFWDYKGDFVTIHDCVGLPPSQSLDEGIQRLKDGFIKSTKHDVWETFCLDNGLRIDPQTPPPVVGDLDLELIRDSKYLYS